jgi:hypothetical protein
VTLIRKAAVVSDITDGQFRLAQKSYRPSNSGVALVLAQAHATRFPERTGKIDRMHAGELCPFAQGTSDGQLGFHLADDG